MKLNVYEKREIVKTYTAETYDLMFGTVEDIADAIKLDDLKTGSDAEILQVVMNLVITCKETVKDLLKDIFPGLTDEEIRRTRVREQAAVIMDVVTFTMRELGKGTGAKN